VVNNNNSSFP